MPKKIITIHTGEPEAKDRQSSFWYEGQVAYSDNYEVLAVGDIRVTFPEDGEDGSQSGYNAVQRADELEYNDAKLAELNWDYNNWFEGMARNDDAQVVVDGDVIDGDDFESIKDWLEWAETELGIIQGYTPVFKYQHFGYVPLLTEREGEVKPKIVKEGTVSRLDQGFEREAEFTKESKLVTLKIKGESREFEVMQIQDTDGDPTNFEYEARDTRTNEKIKLITKKPITSMYTLQALIEQYSAYKGWIREADGDLVSQVISKVKPYVRNETILKGDVENNLGYTQALLPQVYTTEELEKILQVGEADLKKLVGYLEKEVFRRVSYLTLKSIQQLFNKKVPVEKAVEEMKKQFGAFDEFYRKEPHSSVGGATVPYSEWSTRDYYARSSEYSLQLKNNEASAEFIKKLIAEGYEYSEILTEIENEMANKTQAVHYLNNIFPKQYWGQFNKTSLLKYTFIRTAEAIGSINEGDKIAIKHNDLEVMTGVVKYIDQDADLVKVETTFAGGEDLGTMMHDFGYEEFIQKINEGSVVKTAMEKKAEGDWAYTALRMPDEEGRFIVGGCERGIRGYTPLTYSFDTYEDAERWADMKNESLGLTKKEAMIIVMSTMGSKNVPKKEKTLLDREASKIQVMVKKAGWATGETAEVVVETAFAVWLESKDIKKEVEDIISTNPAMKLKENRQELERQVLDRIENNLFENVNERMEGIREIDTSYDFDINEQEVGYIINEVVSEPPEGPDAGAMEAQGDVEIKLERKAITEPMWSPFEPVDNENVAQDMFGKPYSQLTPEEQAEVAKTVPVEKKAESGAGNRSCKYYETCGSASNCAGCKGGYVKKEKKAEAETAVDVREWFQRNFKRKPEDDPMYFKEWQKRWDNGPVPYMDLEGQSIYNELKRSKQTLLEREAKLNKEALNEDARFTIAVHTTEGVLTNRGLTAEEVMNIVDISESELPVEGKPLTTEINGETTVFTREKGTDDTLLDKEAKAQRYTFKGLHMAMDEDSATEYVTAVEDEGGMANISGGYTDGENEVEVTYYIKADGDREAFRLAEQYASEWGIETFDIHTPDGKVLTEEDLADMGEELKPTLLERQSSHEGCDCIACRLGLLRTADATEGIAGKLKELSVGDKFAFLQEPDKVYLIVDTNESGFVLQDTADAKGKKIMVDPGVGEKQIVWWGEGKKQQPKQEPAQQQQQPKQQAQEPQGDVVEMGTLEPGNSFVVAGGKEIKTIVGVYPKYDFVLWMDNAHNPHISEISVIQDVKVEVVGAYPEKRIKELEKKFQPYMKDMLALKQEEKPKKKEREKAGVK